MPVLARLTQKIKKSCCRTNNYIFLFISSKYNSGCYNGRIKLEELKWDRIGKEKLQQPFGK